jgi:glycine hydroxymethyltransferase
VIAGGRLQDPLAEGADLVTFSTYKSFGGPPGGAIVGDDPALMARVADRVYPGLTANYDASRLAPLAVAALDLIEQGPGYAAAMVEVARALGGALAAADVPVLGADRGWTESHHLCVDAAGFGGGVAAARALAPAGIYLSDIGDPRAAGTSSAAAASRACLRIGTQEIVRRGFTARDAPALAALVARVLVEGEEPAGVRHDAVALRRGLGDVWRFCRGV